MASPFPTRIGSDQRVTPSAVPLRPTNNRTQSFPDAGTSAQQQRGGVRPSSVRKPVPHYTSATSTPNPPVPDSSAMQAALGNFERTHSASASVPATRASSFTKNDGNMTTGPLSTMTSTNNHLEPDLATINFGRRLSNTTQAEPLTRSLLNPTSVGATEKDRPVLTSRSSRGSSSSSGGGGASSTTADFNGSQSTYRMNTQKAPRPSHVPTSSFERQRARSNSPRRSGSSSYHPGPSPTTPVFSGESGAGNGGGGHAHRRSHSRQASISLPTPSPTPSPTQTLFNNAMTPSSSSQTNRNSPTTSAFPGKILPLEPVPTRTRAPIEAFASIEMLQGQREYLDRTRGSESWGKDGKYEGRKSSISTQGAGIDNFKAASRSQRLPGATALAPIDVDVASIANQLRQHDAMSRRESEDRKIDLDGNTLQWRRRFSTQSEEDITAGAMDSSSSSFSGRGFSFPMREITTVKAFKADSDGSDDDEAEASPYSEKSLYADVYSSKERLAPTSATNGGWRTEYLGNSEKAYNLHRPSIVALPVYPSPSGTVARSFRYKAKRFASGFSWFTVLLSQAATWVYLGKRLDAMLIIERKIPGAFVAGWGFLVLETILALIMGVHSLWTVFTYQPTSSTPKMRLRGDTNLPAVDVFVIASGESDQVVFDSAIAAASMDYPTHRFRVMVIDPIGSERLEKDINRHSKSQGCPHLSYHRRTLGGMVTSAPAKASKASSINFGMKEAATFGVKGPAEFIAVFEADVIPERNYLRAMLPSILGEGRVALVKTGHGFVNLPHRLSQSTATLMSVCETVHDVRSGFLLRRAALGELGGFPEDSWIQDGCCEALLLGRGYQVSYVDEVLQWGMAKPTYGSQINALMVNRLGPLRTAMRLGFFISGANISMMSSSARIKAIGRALAPIGSIFVVLLMSFYPFLFAYGGIIVLTPNLVNLNHLLQYALVMIVTARLHEIVWCWSTGQNSPRRNLQKLVFSCQYQVVGLGRLVLPSWLGGYPQGSDRDLVQSSSPPSPPSRWRRLAWFIVDPHTGVVFAFTSAISVAIWRISRDYERGTVDMHQSALTVLLTIGWPSMLWLEFVLGSLVPFTCLLFPSRLLTEPRESFVIRDHYSSVARPKHSFKTAPPFKVFRGPELLFGVFLVVYATACVCVGHFTDLFS